MVSVPEGRRQLSIQRHVGVHVQDQHRTIHRVEMLLHVGCDQGRFDELFLLPVDSQHEWFLKADQDGRSEVPMRAVAERWGGHQQTTGPNVAMGLQTRRLLHWMLWFAVRLRGNDDGKLTYSGVTKE